MVPESKTDSTPCVAGANGVREPLGQTSIPLISLHVLQVHCLLLLIL